MLGLLLVKLVSLTLPRHSKASIQVRNSYAFLLEELFIHYPAPDIHWAVVTVAGLVDSGNEYYSSEKIAHEYWNLYVQKKTDWQVEVVH